MSLLPFFQWCYQTAIGEGIRNSTWLFPVIEAFHLLGLGLTAGTVLIVDLRLFGVGLRKQPAAQLWASTRPWLIGGVIVMFVSGIPLFLSEIDQVLLQLSVLGEDDLAAPGADFHLHRSAPRDPDEPLRRSSAAGPSDRNRVACPVVWRGLGRTLDRIFVTSVR